jgi:hypothetical protein
MPGYADCVARYVIDAPTLVHLVDAGLHVGPGHQLVTVDPRLATTAQGTVAVAAIDDLLAPG